MDLATSRDRAQLLPRASAAEASNHDGETARFQPALVLLEEAASKIALYEQSFERLEELELNADQAEADKRQLLDHIADMAQRLQESEANYEKTLSLLQTSTQICMLQRMEIQAMRETLSEGSSHASLMADYMKRLALIIAQTGSGEPTQG
jgi:predicted nuclease with TOPRIM domain